MAANAAIARSRRLLVLAGYATLLVGFVGISVMPFLHHRVALQAELESLQHTVDARLKGHRRLDDVQRQVQLASLLTRDYDRLVPAEPRIDGFIEQLSRELDRAGLKDVVVRGLAKDTLGKTQRYPIEVHARGTFAQFRAFLKSVESLPRMSSIGRLSIDADSELGGYVEAQLTLYIYSSNPPS